MPLSDGDVFAGYTIERRLGAGGMGEVYLARHPRLPRHDAIKVLRADISADPAYIERFNREADLASKLWHPHIVGIHDRGKDDGQLWISMDFADGSDASLLLKERYPKGMPPRLVVDVVKAVASALDYAHGRGLLHRDVKPANILLTDGDDRRILLVDFGIAREVGDSAAGLTATNMTVGTAAYAAPEQLMGHDVDGRADQYALAATAYQLLTGEQLFAHSNAAVVIGKHLNAPPPQLAHTRPELAAYDAALAVALAKDPAHRFATCLDFARALEHPEPRTQYAAARFAPPSAPPPVQPLPPLPPMSTPPAPPSYPPQSYPPQSYPPAPPPQRSIVPFALAGAAIVAIVALVAVVVVQTNTGSSGDEPFTLAGTVHLTDDVVQTSALPAGFACAGTGEYADVAPNAPITVEDEAGTLLAKGALGESNTETDGCAMHFEVTDVPSGSEFYRVHVGQREEMSFTEDEAKAGVDFLMGTTGSTPSSPASSSTRTTTVAPTQNPEQAALATLQRMANTDRSAVLAEFADVWIPQISSKRVGLVAEGRTWDNQAILEEHQRLRSQYPDVKLLWSGDWSTFDGRDFWVTVVGLWSNDPDDVLSWCTRNGFDRDHCLAKVVSTWRPVSGSTKLN